MYVRFQDNIQVADLAVMGLLFLKNQGAEYLLYVINIFIKYAWVKPFKDKKVETVLHGFIGIITESKHRSNKLLADQVKEFYDSLMQKWLDDSDTLMHSIF